MSDTPRTDAEVMDAKVAHKHCSHVVSVQFAMQLERELAEAKKPKPCEHTHRQGWTKGGTTEMWCTQCGHKLESAELFPSGYPLFGGEK